MSLSLPSTAVISYNNVSFGAYTKTANITCRPVLDSANRTVMYNEYSMDVKSVISQGSVAATNFVAQLCRSALTKVGGVLVVRGLATGDHYVNTAGIRDVCNGPIPRVLSFTPAVGGRLTSTIDWSITWCVPECYDAKFIFKAMEYVFSLTWTIDSSGMTTRSMRGHVRVPQNRYAVGARIPQDSADFYREQLEPEFIPGFRRRYGPFTLNEDRSQLDWEFIDEEMGVNILPVGVAEADASMTISTNGVAGAIWQATVTGRYDLPKAGSVNTAVNAFTLLLTEKLKAVRQVPIAQPPSNQPPKIPGPGPIGSVVGGAGGLASAFAARSFGQSKANPLLVAFSMTENTIYGPHRRFSFSASFTFLTTLRNILTSNLAGIGAPLKDSNWQKWAYSLVPTVLNPRGSAQLVFDVGRDTITDLCGSGGVIPPQDVRRPDAQVRDILEGEPFTPPTPDNSWIDYRISYRRETYDRTLTQSVLPYSPVTDVVDLKGEFDPGTGLVAGIVAGGAGGILGGGGVGNKPQGLGGIVGPIAGGLAGLAADRFGGNQAVRRGRPTVYIICEGSAVRAGFLIPEPKIETINGVKVLPANRWNHNEGFNQDVAYRTPTGVMVMAAKWKLRYALQGDLPPQEILEDPPRPM